MTSDVVDALIDVVQDDRGEPVDCDGLHLQRGDEGYRLAIAGAERTGLTESDVRQVLAANHAHVSNWAFWRTIKREHREADVEFLRWLERADTFAISDRYDRSIEREWGQLLVTTHVEQDGQRSYSIRHRADRDAVAADLEQYDDPRAARELATFDDRERYRPLKTAPSLATGWRFPRLGYAELLAAVRWLYPATVENWHLERAGELDVAHWRETADRQTGIYADLVDVDREAVRWATRACCTDDACLKRRRWGYAEGTTLDVPPGEGAFPCREPCSFLLEAAREWTQIETEATDTYTIDLTPSERRQLQAIVEAMGADERTGHDVADFEEATNRRRVRYLLAKRFEDGEGFRDREADG